MALSSTVCDMLAGVMCAGCIWQVAPGLAVLGFGVVWLVSSWVFD